MTDKTTTANGNGGTTFWADLSKKGGTWAGVAAIGGVACALLSGDASLGEVLTDFETHGAVAGLAALLRVALGLVQGKTGNPETAKFDKAAG